HPDLLRRAGRGRVAAPAQPSPRARAPRRAGARRPRGARPVRRGGSRLGVLSLPPVQRTAATRRRPLRGHRPASHGVAAPVLRLALPHDRTGGPARCSPRTPLVPAVAGTLSPRRARRSLAVLPGARVLSPAGSHGLVISVGSGLPAEGGARDRKSTRLNYSHGSTSYAVVCFKKK